MLRFEHLCRDRACQILNDPGRCCVHLCSIRTRKMPEDGQSQCFQLDDFKSGPRKLQSEQACCLRSLRPVSLDSAFDKGQFGIALLRVSFIRLDPHLSPINAGVNADLKLDRKAGLQRPRVTFSSGQVYRWPDFQVYGWTRSLPSTWMSSLP
jgi:hypothetical protein